MSNTKQLVTLQNLYSQNLLKEYPEDTTEILTVPEIVEAVFEIAFACQSETEQAVYIKVLKNFLKL